MEAESRISYWDNCRAVLIYLVVLGHILIRLETDIPLLDTLARFIYLFHMPAFFLISGFFSGSYLRKNRSGRIGHLAGYLILYLVFIAALQLDNLLLHEGIDLKEFLYCDGAPWFLLSMLFCHLLLPLFVILGTLPAAFVSLGLSLAWSLLPLPDSLLSLHRTFTFLPFFLLGFFMTRGALPALPRPGKAMKAEAVAVLVLGWAAASRLVTKSIRPILYAQKGYRFYSTFPMHKALLLKGGWYLLALLLTCGFLVLVIPKKTFFTFVGRYTLPVYVFHRIVLGFFKKVGLMSLFSCSVLPALFQILLTALGLTVIFGNRFCDGICRLAFLPGKIMSEKSIDTKDQ